MFAAYKPIAKDTAKARKLLKEAGIKTYVSLSLRTIYIGRQCERLTEQTARAIISILESNGFKLSQSDCISSLINNNCCDTMNFYVIER